MQIHYNNNKIRKQLSSATEIKKAFGINAKKVAQRLDDIQSSGTLSILMQIPSANCHELIGDRKGEWALNISPNHRLIFKIAHDPVPENEDGSVNTILVTDIEIIGTTDYH